MTLTDLPTELLTHILIYLRPIDILRLGQTCRHIHNVSRPDNHFVWHAAFLQVFDNPQHAWSLSDSPHGNALSPVEHQVEHWYKRLRQRTIALNSISSSARGPIESYGLAPEEVIETLLDIIDTAKTGPTKAELSRGVQARADDRRSLNLGLLSPIHSQWDRLENLIHDCHAVDPSPVDLGRPVTRAVSLARKRGPRSEAASRLHVLYGRTIRERIESGAKGAARRIVYDWNNPLPANEYGPFKKDHSGQVDWKILEAVMSLMLRHFDMGADGKIAVPPGFCYSIPCRTLFDPTIPEDWAHLTGQWVGTYSFLDYPDLFAFNTQESEWDMEEVAETHGDLMIMDLKLDMSLQDDPKYRSTMPASQDMPTLYFSGSSKSFDPYMLPRIHIGVKGSVSLCASKREVRWRYLISYRGQEQWQLEGVQPGGVRSGPVYGLWTQWGHDEHAPVGAFMYVPEELCKRQELVYIPRER